MMDPGLAAITPTPTPINPTDVPYRVTWCPIDSGALRENLAGFRAMVGPHRVLAPVVKSNAYGHGLILAARAFLEAGADWLCVNDLDEAQQLRQADIQAPIYVLGPVFPDQVHEAVALDVRFVIYDLSVLNTLKAVTSPQRPARVHIKLETGNNRQGLPAQEALDLARKVQALPHVELEGISSHYANVEDTTDSSFARLQLQRFNEFLAALSREGIHPPLSNFSNSAATILWPSTWFRLVRVGISAYGMWPSKETMVSAVLESRQDQVVLRPAMSWKTRIAQVKMVPKGEFIGYGCSFRTTHTTRLAVLPIGYRDGYDRRLSNLAHVLIGGAIAPVRGRVCMNLTMVDVTDIPQSHAQVGSEVLLMGPNLPAEKLAGWCGTINYEITTRIHPSIPRVPEP